MFPFFVLAPAKQSATYLNQFFVLDTVFSIDVVDQVNIATFQLEYHRDFGFSVSQDAFFDIGLVFIFCLFDTAWL